MENFQTIQDEIVEFWFLFGVFIEFGRYIVCFLGYFYWISQKVDRVLGNFSILRIAGWLFVWAFLSLPRNQSQRFFFVGLEGKESDVVFEAQLDFWRHIYKYTKHTHIYTHTHIHIGIFETKMSAIEGVISRQVLPACGSLCFFCPAMRARSRQPVKRYKKLIADIFPRNQVCVSGNFVVSWFSMTRYITGNSYLCVKSCVISPLFDLMQLRLSSQMILAMWPENGNNLLLYWSVYYCWDNRIYFIFLKNLDK